MPRRRNVVPVLVLLTAAALACSRGERRPHIEPLTVARMILRVRAPQLIEPITKPVQRSSNPQLEFEVQLSRPPLGVALELTCQWRGPAKERYENGWETKPISHDPWPTHCRHAFTPNDAAGLWTVIMRFGDRDLGSQFFTLE